MITIIRKSIKILLLIGLSCNVSSCLMLFFTGPTQFNDTVPVSQHSKQPPALKNQPRVYTMRGFMDVFSTGMNDLTKKINLQLGIKSTALSYLEEKKLSNYLIHEYQAGRKRGPIVLIGHSFGADEQITVANRLNKAHVPVALLITLDNTKTQIIPPNVHTFYNINSGRSMLSMIVPWGTPLVAADKHTNMITVNLSKHRAFSMVNHFNIDKLPAVQNYLIDIIQKTVRDCKKGR